MNREAPHPAQCPVGELEKACRFRRQRRSGPGGQHRNKVETAVFVYHQPSGLTASASERRSQAENRRVALFRLRKTLSLRIRTPSDSQYTTTPLWQMRCRGGRLYIAPDHEDFPSILAEALDALSWENYDVARAAERLGCTRSQLVRLLRIEPSALADVNQARRRFGMSVLR